LNNDIQINNKSCEVCLRNFKSVLRKAPLMNVGVIIELREKLALYIVEKLDKSKQGYRYILIRMSLGTHFVFAFPMKKIFSFRSCKNFQ